MCWVPAHPVSFGVAKEDIAIIKIVSKENYDGKFDCSAAYHENGYKLNKIYTAVIPESTSGIDIDVNLSKIQYGYHSYDPSKIYLEHESPSFSNNVYCVKSINYDRPLDWWNSSDFIVVEGIIPKGSYYYLNDIGEYVSSSIVLKNFISLEYYNNLIR